MKKTKKLTLVIFINVAIEARHNNTLTEAVLLRIHYEKSGEDQVLPAAPAL